MLFSCFVFVGNVVKKKGCNGCSEATCTFLKPNILADYTLFKYYKVCTFHDRHSGLYTYFADFSCTVGSDVVFHFHGI